MAASIIEGIDNEVLFIFSVFVAFVAIILVNVVYKLTGNSSNGQNESNPGSNSNSTTSYRPEDQTQERTREEQVPETIDAGPVTEAVTQITASLLHTDVTEENTSEPVNNANNPPMDSMPDGVRRRGPAENTPPSDSQSSTPEDNISIRVKFMENERTMSVHRTMTVGELKRVCFSNDLNSGRRVRLIYSGRLLQDDNAPLSFYGVANYSVVHAQISDSRRDPNEQSARQNEEEDLDVSKLFLPLLAAILIFCWYGLCYHRHLFSAASIIILVFATLAYGALVHVMLS